MHQKIKNKAELCKSLPSGRLCTRPGGFWNEPPDPDLLDLQSIYSDSPQAKKEGYMGHIRDLTALEIRLLRYH